MNHFSECIHVFHFFRRGSSGCRVGEAVKSVAVTNQDLYLSHVMRRGSASVWRAWLERSVTAVAMVTMVSMPTAAQVVKQSRWKSVWLLSFLSQLWSGCYLFSSQHALVITLEGTVTLRLVCASALPTLRETAATGVRQATGVMTPQLAARYTQIHTNTRKVHTHRHQNTQIHRKYRHTHTLTPWCLYSRAAAVQQEAPLISVL